MIKNVREKGRGSRVANNDFSLMAIFFPKRPFTTAGVSEMLPQPDRRFFPSAIVRRRELNNVKLRVKLILLRHAGSRWHSGQLASYLEGKSGWCKKLAAFWTLADGERGELPGEASNISLQEVECGVSGFPYSRRRNTDAQRRQPRRQRHWRPSVVVASRQPATSGSTLATKL